MNRSYFEEVLNEDYDMVPPDIIAVIAALPRLRHLEIASLELGDEGLKGLTGLENNWTTLNLNCCDISAEGMKVFCESDGIKTLTTLDIGSNNLGEEGVKILLASLWNLESLSLDWEKSGVGEAFGQAQDLRNSGSESQAMTSSAPRSLHSPCGTVALSRAPLTALRRLELHRNFIGDAGIKAIASSPNLGELRFLNVSNCGITDEGAKALANSPYLERLERVELGDALSEEVQKALRSRFGEGVKFKFPWTQGRLDLRRE